MDVLPFDLTPVGSGPDRRLSLLLEEGWRRGVERGAVAYDPARVETVTVAPIRFYYLPGREARPRSPIVPGDPSGLRRPHRPCPFDSEEFLREREVFRIRGGDRLYHVALNKYPVLWPHYLGVRPASAPTESLPQRITGANEIEDMALFAALLGPPWRLFFNSNRGSDGSRSGSSVNHWHFQLFPTGWGVASMPVRYEKKSGGVSIGAIADWPARHRLYISSDASGLGEAVWRDLGRVDELDRAYNLEVLARPEGDVEALLFPRAPVPDLALPSGGTLPGDFGGFELSGGVVVPAQPAFDWVRAHPEEARRLVLERVRAGTAEPPALTAA